MGVGEVITKYLPGFPRGNPGELHAAAATWSNVAGTLRTTIDDSQGQIATLSASWKGSGKDSFEQEWNKLAAAAQDGCDELAAVAASLNQAADKLADAQHRYEVAAGAAAVTATVGIALTVFTFGVSDEVAAGAAAAEVGAATEVAAEAISLAETLLSAAVRIASQIVTRFVVFLGVDLAAQGGISTVVYPDHNPFGHLDFNSALSVAAGMAMPDLPGGTFAQIGAGALFGAGQDALTQALATGKVDPGEVLFNATLGGLSAGVGAGLNRAIGSLRDPEVLARGPNDLMPVGDPVDVATGDVILSQVDMALPGTLPLVLERSHRSSWRAGRWFGASWISSFDQRLEISSTQVRGLFSDGRILTWPLPRVSGDDERSGANTLSVDGPSAGDAARTLPVSGAAWPLLRLADGSYTVSDPRRGLTWRFERQPADHEAAAADGQVELPVVEVRDAGGQRISFRYDERGRPAGVSHSGGYESLVTVADGHVTSLALRAPDGDILVARYEYDGHGNLSGVINSSGLPLRFSYDDDGRLTGWLDRNGHSYRYSYDAQGRCVRGAGPHGVLSGTFSYDDDALVTRWSDDSGAVTTFEMTPSRRVAAVTDPLGHVTSWEHDARGRVAAHADQLGRVTRYAYDWADNVTTITRPDGSQAHAGYDERSRPVLLTQPDGGTWRQEYDERGNRTALIAPDGTSARFTYDASGHLASITDTAGAVTQVVCDGAGLLIAQTGPSGERTRYSRDPFGRVAEVTSPDGGGARLSWTVEGLLAARLLPDGNTESWDYDGEGNVTFHHSSAGEETRYEYGPFDLLTALTRPDGTRSDFEYDHELRLVSIRHGGLTWRYEYDAAGRLVSETDYNRATTTYSYDPAGQLTRRVNAVAQQVTFRYDRLGNLIERTADADVTTFDYDGADRLVGARNGDADLLFARDAAGRVISETCNGRVVRSQYDPMGRLTSRTTPSGATTNWAYDQAGHPTSMTAGSYEIAFGYDAGGRESRRDLPGGLTLSQDWDQRGRLTLQTLADTGRSRPEGPAIDGQSVGRVLQRRQYTYRPDGFVTAIDDLLSGYRAVGLDPTGRVTAVTGRDWTEQYAYDQAGNVTSASWPPQAPAPDASWFDAEAQGHRQFSGTLIARAGSISYQHDHQGRVIQRQRRRVSRKPDTWRYEWDADNRLTAVTTPDGVMWRYRYDPFGRRVAKQRLAADGNVAEQTDFTWDGTVLVEQSATSVSLGREAVVSWNYLPGTFTPLTQAERMYSRDAAQEQVDQRFYSIVTDLIGTPTELTSPDGTLAGHQRQTLWGGTTWDPTGAQTPLRFPGQYEDPETGLYYNNQRYYDPTSGNYLTPDPLGLAPSPNPHTYVPNPHVLSDPLGLMPCGPSNPPWINASELPTVEGAALDKTIQQIDNGTVPGDATRIKWGVPFQNKDSDLPGGQFGNSPYREYRVSPPPGMPTPGPLRVVKNEISGEIYYTWTHYGDGPGPPFVRIRLPRMEIIPGLHNIEASRATVIAKEAVLQNIPVYIISTDGRAGREAFFDAVRSALPLNPPVLGSRSWEALSDSLWEGLRSLGAHRVVILWPDAASFGEAAPNVLDVALSVLADVAESLADPQLTAGDPVSVSVYVTKSSG